MNKCCKKINSQFVVTPPGLRKNSLEVPGSRIYFSVRALVGHYRTEKVIKAYLSEARLNVGRTYPPLKLEHRNILSGVCNTLQSQANPVITEPRKWNEKVTHHKLKNGFRDLHSGGIPLNSLNIFNVSLHPEEELASRG